MQPNLYRAWNERSGTELPVRMQIRAKPVQAVLLRPETTEPDRLRGTATLKKFSGRNRKTATAYLRAGAEIQ